MQARLAAGSFVAGAAFGFFPPPAVRTAPPYRPAALLS
jgi:hypothetical protein